METEPSPTKLSKPMQRMPEAMAFTANVVTHKKSKCTDAKQAVMAMPSRNRSVPADESRPRLVTLTRKDKEGLA